MHIWVIQSRPIGQNTGQLDPYKEISLKELLTYRLKPAHNLLLKEIPLRNPLAYRSSPGHNPAGNSENFLYADGVPLEFCQ